MFLHGCGSRPYGREPHLLIALLLLAQPGMLRRLQLRLPRKLVLAAAYNNARQCQQQEGAYGGTESRHLLDPLPFNP